MEGIFEFFRLPVWNLTIGLLGLVLMFIIFVSLFFLGLLFVACGQFILYKLKLVQEPRWHKLTGK